MTVGELPPVTPSRTPKEMKRWQQAQERSRRDYMKENDIKLEDVLTVEKYKEYKRLNYTGSYIRREYTGQSYGEYREWCRASGVTPLNDSCGISVETAKGLEKEPVL